MDKSLVFTFQSNAVCISDISHWISSTSDCKSEISEALHPWLCCKSAIACHWLAIVHSAVDTLVVKAVKSEVFAFPAIALATSQAVWNQLLFVNSEILSQGWIAVAPNAALLLIVAKSLIVFCFVFNAFVTTLFSTALVEEVDNAESIVICSSFSNYIIDNIIISSSIIVWIFYWVCIR